MTREELFKLVWAQPVKRVAKQVGMSDRGLAARCEKFNIPLPPRGYWAKVEAGAMPSVPELPVATDLEGVEIEFQVQPKDLMQAQASSIDEPPKPRQTLRSKCDKPVNVKAVAPLSEGIEGLLELGLKERQAAAACTHLLQVLLLAERLEPAIAIKVKNWVSAQSCA